jgi:hypothetical protein
MTDKLESPEIIQEIGDKYGETVAEFARVAIAFRRRLEEHPPKTKQEALVYATVDLLTIASTIFSDHPATAAFALDVVELTEYFQVLAFEVLTSAAKAGSDKAADVVERLARDRNAASLAQRLGITLDSGR